MSPRAAVRVLAAGRGALGLAVMVAPERVTARWLGSHARHPVVRYLARSLGVRDLALGMLALRTLDDPALGSHVQVMCAMADSVDALATVAARSELPAAGAIGTVAVAGTAAAAGLYLARELART